MPRTKKLQRPRLALSTVGSIIVLLIIALTIAEPSPSEPMQEESTLYSVQNNNLVQYSVRKDKITQTSQPSVVHSGIDQVFDWSNGSTRSFLISLSPSQDTPATGDLWLLDASGAKTFIATDVISASFSPTEAYIAFTTSPRRGTLKLNVATPQGEVLYTINGAGQLSWSPDGTQAIYAAPSEDVTKDDHRIVLMHLLSGETRILTSGQQDGNPIFHPSGLWVLFVNGTRSGISSLWAIATTGGDPIQLTNIDKAYIDESFVPPPPRRSYWSPDHRLLAYEYVHRSTSTIWVLGFDASRPEVLFTRRLGPGSSPRWLDRDTIVAIVNENETIAYEVNQ